MDDLKQLPYMIELLDDESEEVVEHIKDRLKELGPDLKSIIVREGIDLNPDVEHQIDILSRDLFWDGILSRWKTLAVHPPSLEKLEEGLTILGDFLDPNSDVYLPSALDELAAGFEAKYKKRDVFKLCHYLFKVEKLRGNREHYYDPQNSNLAEVVTARKGNPISLCTVLILVAKRVDLKVYGCNLPGHFLAFAPHPAGDGEILIDCYNGGYTLMEKDIRKLFKQPKAMDRQKILVRAEADVILARFLQNLIHSFNLRNRDADRAFVERLLQVLKGARNLPPHGQGE